MSAETGEIPVAAARGRSPLDLPAITRAASREAGDVPADLLGDYLEAVLDAARTGRRLPAAQLARYREAGARAAEGGVALRGLVDLYLSATWRLWRELPGPSASVAALRAAGLAVLRGADDAVAAAAEGFERARLSIARRQEAERLEFVEDLLTGRGGLASLVVRGERLGLRLAGPQQVVLAAGQAPGGRVLPLDPDAERVVAVAADPAPTLTATRGGQLVAITGAPEGDEGRRVAAALARSLSARDPAGPGERPWRIAIGRAYPGPGGVLRSYEEASDALAVAGRLRLADPVADAAGLLVYQVLFRDRAAMADLVEAMLGPLRNARGGAAPLLATLEAYFSSGRIAAAAARQLHLSVRAVTYRLARIRALTGKDPADPGQQLALHVAVTGARLLDWPAAAGESP
ncbi:MAG TPA: helix-turn-helix domain-containing protein [Streptosporangiaceae bacterium]|jgi:sugar diacid utilization regulator